MDQIKIRFAENLEDFRLEIERTIDTLFRAVNPVFSIPARTWKPQMDVYETPEDVIMIVEMAGVRKEDLEIEIDPRAARISGKRQEIPRGTRTRFHLAEIPYGDFERVIPFPAYVDPRRSLASYSNGLLQIRVKKR